MKHLDLFSGIGGFALATEMVWDNVEHIFCDNEPFAQAVLSKHWPNSLIHGDIKTLVPTPADIVTGGFPCQPFSSAGLRRGTQDDRHLWPEMLRVIRLANPRWVIGENVGGLVTWSDGMVLEQIHLDLEAEGYEVQAFIIPAVSLNAPHRRDRVWIVANCKSTGCKGRNRIRTQRSDNSKKWRKTWSKNQRRNWDRNWLEVATRLCTLDDGLPRGLARPKGWRNAALKGAGNAIVPQVAAEIMRAIKNIDSTMK